MSRVFAPDISGDIDQIPEMVIPVDHPAKIPQAEPNPGIKFKTPMARLFRNIPPHQFLALDY